MKKSFLLVLIITLVTFSCEKNPKGENGSNGENGENEIPLATTDGTVKIARWQGNKKAAMLFYFDDSTVGQAQLGIPIFNQNGLIGTWFVNPGSSYYDYNRQMWEVESKKGNQELANHTMTHTGAENNEEARYEIGEASKIIWKIRGDNEYGSLIAFNRGGGTSWDNVDLVEILQEYKNIDRVTTIIGERMIGQSVKSGSKPNEILKNYPKALKDSIIWMLSFHGIAENDGNPPMDHGNAAVWVEHFKTFAQEAAKLKADFWNGGYIQIYKYIQERKTATAKLLQYSNDKYSVELTSTKDAKYFNEPLTLVINLPKNWDKCKVTLNNKEIAHTINDGVLLINVVPNCGKVYIKR